MYKKGLSEASDAVDQRVNVRLIPSYSYGGPVACVHEALKIGSASSPQFLGQAATQLRVAFRNRDDQVADCALLHLRT